MILATYFFDTCALLYRYADEPNVDRAQLRRVRRLISDRRAKNYVADLSVIEVASGLAAARRRHNWSLRKFDSMYGEFFEDLASEKVRLRAVTQRELVSATHILRFAGVIKRLKLQSADAIIAECCRELAVESGERVVFYTADWKLYFILRSIDRFKRALSLRYLGQGKGGIPPTT